MKDPYESWYDDELPPRKVQRVLLEKDIQKACVEWARAHGWWCRKFSSPANRSVPDYLFARRSPFSRLPLKVAVEFKAPGKTSTKAQIEEQEAMRAADWDVHEIDDIEKFKTLFKVLYP